MSGRGLSLLAEAYQDSADDEDEVVEPGGEKDGGRRVVNTNKEGVGWFQLRCQSQDPDPEGEEEEQQTQIKLGGDSYSFVVEQAVGGSNNSNGGKEICVVEAPEPDTEIEIYFVVEQEESVQDGEEGRVMGGVVGYLKGNPENGGIQGGGDDGSVEGVEQWEEGSVQSQMFFGGRAVRIQELEVGDVVSISGGVQEPSEEEEMFSEAELERARDEIQRQIQREEERKARNKKVPAVLPVPIDENSGMRKARETDGGEEVEKQAVEHSQADPGQLSRGEEQQEMENGVAEAETETVGNDNDGAGADTPDVTLTYPRVDDGHLQPPASTETASACSESLRSEVPEVTTTGIPDEAASSSSTTTTTSDHAHASVITSATKVSRSSRRIAKKRMQKDKKKMTQELPSPSSNLDVPLPNQVTSSGGGGGEQQPETGKGDHQAGGSASATQQSVEAHETSGEEGTRSIQDHIEGEPPLSTGLTEAQQGSQLADCDEDEGFEGGQQQSLLEPLTENVSEPISSASASVHAESTEANRAPPTAPAEVRVSRRLAQKRLKKMESKSSNSVPVPIDNQHQVISNPQSQPPHSQSNDTESRPPPQAPEVPTERNLMIMPDSAPSASTATSAGSSSAQQAKNTEMKDNQVAQQNETVVEDNASISIHPSRKNTGVKIRSSRRIAKKKRKQNMEEELPPSTGLEAPVIDQVQVMEGEAQQQPNQNPAEHEATVAAADDELPFPPIDLSAARQQPVPDVEVVEEEDKRDQVVDGDCQAAADLNLGTVPAQPSDDDNQNKSCQGSDNVRPSVGGPTNKKGRSRKRRVVVKRKWYTDQQEQDDATTTSNGLEAMTNQVIPQQSCNAGQTSRQDQAFQFQRSVDNPGEEGGIGGDREAVESDVEVAEHSNQSSQQADVGSSSVLVEGQQSAQSQAPPQASDDVVALDLTATLNQQERTEGRSETVIRRTPSRFLKSRKSSATATERRLGLSLLTSDGRKANCCFFNFRRNANSESTSQSNSINSSNEPNPSALLKEVPREPEVTSSPAENEEELVPEPPSPSSPMDELPEEADATVPSVEFQEGHSSFQDPPEQDAAIPVPAVELSQPAPAASSAVTEGSSQCTGVTRTVRSQRLAKKAAEKKIRASTAVITGSSSSSQSDGLLPARRGRPSRKVVDTDEIGACTPIKILQGRNKKKFKCPGCSKVYPYRSTTIQHMYVHNREKCFQCPQCPKRFTRPNIIKRHMKIHSGERPHQCPRCPASFLYGWYLPEHIQRHEGIKPYRCNVGKCGKRFVSVLELRSHKYTHTSRRPFKCNLCEKDYKEQGSLSRHIKRSHPREWSKRKEN